MIDLGQEFFIENCGFGVIEVEGNIHGRENNGGECNM